MDEWFGYDVADTSPEALSGQSHSLCPFIDATCTKGPSASPTGACSAHQTRGNTLAICPNRLYDAGYRVLSNVAREAFGTSATVIHPDEFHATVHDGTKVVAFGKGYGRELRLPSRDGVGSYYVDWILARISGSAQLAEFVAVEVQTIDTTNSYSETIKQLRLGNREPVRNDVGLNWENVSKRILPQLIYKGHVLRHEKLCHKGLFFICPEQVYSRILTRLGGGLTEYYHQPGAITFHPYALDGPNGTRRQLAQRQSFTTT
ncbi:MAG: hypothetical protein J0I13_09055, partial [Rhizobiales bacterium]|nr:hypothetical protein [Hyphomicrobiales bacterium]